MVRPEYDVSLINRIANSAAVRPFVDYRVDQSKPLDFTPAVGPIERTGIIFLSNGKDALSAFALSDAMEWQAHAFFADTCRGAKAVEIGRQMIDFMKPRANLIWASIPVGNRKARWFARQMGFRAIGQDQFEAEGAVEIVAHGDGPPRLGFILQNEVIH